MFLGEYETLFLEGSILILFADKPSCLFLFSGCSEECCVCSVNKSAIPGKLTPCIDSFK